MRKSHGIFLLFLLISSCTSGGGIPLSDDYLQRKYSLKSPASPQSFTICYSGGCERLAHINISKKQWSKITTKIKKSKNAKLERQNIAAAIGRLETIAGAQSMTHNDQGGNAFSGGGQMDCMDESINTSQYLLMLQESGALKYHTVLLPTMRSMILFGLHRTAQIQDKKTGDVYAVDSWFENNGQKPYIVPISEWMNNWHPPKN